MKILVSLAWVREVERSLKSRHALYLLFKKFLATLPPDEQQLWKNELIELDTRVSALYDVPKVNKTNNGPPTQNDFSENSTITEGTMHDEEE